MVVTAIKKQILADLDRLAPEQQQRAADLVHSLVVELPAGARADDLLPLVGTLDEGSAREMAAAIEGGCERVDPRDW